MGTLTLPDTGQVYLDASPIIYSVDLFITNDSDFRRVPGLPVTLLTEVAVSNP